MKDTTFYDSESSQYSEKRYPKVAKSYTQFFFNRRLAINKKYIAHIRHVEQRSLSLLELGCADGIVVRELAASFPDVFSSLIGIDISPGMIAEATKKNTLPHATFMLRSEYVQMPAVDIINETGVINYAGFDGDIEFVCSNLQSGGWYVLSVAGTGSLRNMLKPEGGFTDFRSYKEYEQILQEKFVVHHIEGCGVFVPYVWRAPWLARSIGTLLEAVVGTLAPGLCHEKMYLLQKK